MNKRHKLIIGSVLAALAIIVSVWGYYKFHVRTDTPGYAIEVVGEALENHDVRTFHRAVDVDSVINSGYDGFIEGLTVAERTATPETKDAIENFTQIFRAPIITSMKAALDSYVATGKIDANDFADVKDILERTGLKDCELRDVKNVEVNDADRDEAFADVIVFQPELDREFPIQIVLRRDNGQWKVVSIKNFRDYVEQIMLSRRVQLDEYLAKVGEINSRHDAALREGEKKYGVILSRGDLSKDETRTELKKLLIDNFKSDWEARRQDFLKLHVPREAQPLHDLHMKICDLAVDAAQNYAAWMDDRSSVTIKLAEERINQVKTLMVDAAAMARRMTS